VVDAPTYTVQARSVVVLALAGKRT
jgi:hypothetical protein